MPEVKTITLIAGPLDGQTFEHPENEEVFTWPYRGKMLTYVRTLSTQYFIFHSEEYA